MMKSVWCAVALAGLSVGLARAAVTWDVYPGDSIQEAINQSANGDVVVVHPGVYVETLNFHGKSITVQSTAPEDSTVVFATRVNANHQGSVVQFVSEEGGDAVLDGLALTGGNGTVYATGRYGGESRAGGGIFCSNGASPLIRRCLIFSNRVEDGSVVGGGIYCANGAAPMISDCLVRNNELHNYVWKASGGGIAAFSALPTISGCSISGNYIVGEWARGGGIYCKNSDILVENCTIADNVADDNGGMALGGGIYYRIASPTITDCLISGNRVISNNGRGGGVCGSDYPTDQAPYLLRCTVIDNSAEGNSGGGGIYAAAQITLERCTIAHNWSGSGWGAGGILKGFNSPTLASCIVWDNSPSEIDDGGTGFDVRYSDVKGGWAGTGNIDADPLFCDVRCELNDFGLAAASPCLGTGEGGVDMGAHGQSCDTPLTGSVVIEVPGDYASIQAAVDAACDGDSVVIAPGTYLESGIDFAGKPLVVRGVDPEDPAIVAATIVDGQGGGPIFLFQSSEDGASQLQGLTIQNGAADQGAGIYCGNGATPHISHCWLRNNHAVADGGGAFCNDVRAEFRNCRFEANSAVYGGGAGARAGDPIFIDCEFVGNTASSGGGYFNSGGEDQLLRCSFVGNDASYEGGGVALGSNTNMVACTFVDNGAKQGGGISFNTARWPVATRNCVLSGNHAEEHGAAIYGASSVLTLDHFTVVDNYGAPEAVYCINYAQERTVAVNSIFWNDGLDELYVWDDQLDVTYSDIQGGRSGDGNIDAEPNLRNARGFVAVPWPGSPCIDSGTGDADGVDWLEIHPVYGQFNGPAPDMGAYGGPGDTDWLQ